MYVTKKGKHERPCLRLESVHNMEKLITDFITRRVSHAAGGTTYREPLVGFARAGDPLFQQLKAVAGPEHLLPEDLLPEARSVVAFFVPFDRELVRVNRLHPYVAREWALAYIETNRLLEDICGELAGELAGYGINVAWQLPTHNFDQQRLVAAWSHKHVAYICGLGTFGRHTMLITARGCAGRLGTLVLDYELRPSSRPEQRFYEKCVKCHYCSEICPVQALGEHGLDKQLCYQYLLEIDAYYADLPVCDVCGKCATGPCAVR